jgi:hypothetical protein
MPHHSRRKVGSNDPKVAPTVSKVTFVWLAFGFTIRRYASPLTVGRPAANTVQKSFDPTTVEDSRMSVPADRMKSEGTR